MILQNKYTFAVREKDNTRQCQIYEDNVVPIRKIGKKRNTLIFESAYYYVLVYWEKFAGCL